ncbi:MAG TPA: permease, partial [Casimicrobiaceae bacterium]|nr:permease [Casimicrobiaceae bacterium]
ALVLGFGLSAVVQAVVSKREMSCLLPDSSPKTLTVACGLGVASSSCSYAAVALTRSLVTKGANFTSAMAFQLASTNLVAELGILLAILVGWQFTVAEFAGGFLMVAIMAILFRVFLRERLRKRAVEQARRGIEGRMEGHAAMDMAVTEGPVWKRITSKKGLTATSHYFIMDWAAIWPDIVLGLVIAGALAAWVPKSFWSAFFLKSHPLAAKFWGPVIGPLVAILSFVCSVGNVPLAAVLWNNGISFGGVVAFLFADLLVLPILDIYRKYYGWKMSGFILATFYVAMLIAALIVEFVFSALHLVPTAGHARIATEGIRLNYTTILNIIFLVVAVLLLVRFFRTGGMKMMHMMNRPRDSMRHRTTHPA